MGGDSVCMEEQEVKVAFFSAKPYDKVFFERAWAAHVRFSTEVEGLHAPRIGFNYIENRLVYGTAELAQGATVVCCFVNDQVDANVLARLASYGVRLVAMRCAGYNNVDLKAARANSITVVRVPAYSPYAVAEHAVSLFTCLNRKLHKAYNRIRDDNYSLDGLVGRDIHGMTVGVIGTGKIGECFARIMLGFGVHLLAYDIHQNQVLVQLGAEYVDTLPDLLSRSDLVSLHCPLFDSTYHIIDSKAVAIMKKGCIIINTSRGGLIDTEALIDGIKSRHLGGAGIDVYENEAEIFYSDFSCTGIDDEALQILKSYPNVLITSHQGFLTETALATIAEVTLSNIHVVMKGEQCENVVEALKR